MELFGNIPGVVLSVILQAKTNSSISLRKSLYLLNCHDTVIPDALFCEEMKFSGWSGKSKKNKLRE